MTAGHNRREKARRKRRRLNGAYMAKKDEAKRKAAAQPDAMTARETEAIAMSARMAANMSTVGAVGAGCT